MQALQLEIDPTMRMAVTDALRLGAKQYIDRAEDANNDGLRVQYLTKATKLYEMAEEVTRG